MQNIDAYEREVLSRAAFGKITREYSLVEESIRIITVSEKRAPNNLPIAVGEYCRTRFGTSGGEVELTVTKIDNEDHSTYYDTEYDIKAAERNITEAAEGGSLYADIFTLFYKRVEKWKLLYLSSWDSSTVSTYYFNDEELLQKCFSVLKSAEKDDAFVLYAIARAYAEGRGTAVNTSLAESYYKRSAALGMDMAEVQLAALAIEHKGSEDELRSAYEVLTRVKESRPEHNTVAYYIGVCNYYGLGTEQNYSRAFSSFSVGLVSGGDSDVHTHDELYHRRAYMRGLCRFFGQGTQRSLPGARAEFLSAIIPEGSPEAKYAYGTVMLMYNPGAWRSTLGAIRSAAEEGYLPAVRMLAELYRIGYGAEYDGKVADELLATYERCRELGYETNSDIGTEADEYLPKV